MKNILSILLLISTSSFSQEFPMYSKIWRKSEIIIDGKSQKEIIPKNYKSFTLKLKPVQDSINIKSIEKNFLKSFNEFRNDYGKPSVKEDLELSKKSKEYSKQIVNNFEHDKNLGDGVGECIGTLSFTMLTRITKEDGDFNTLVAESCFDLFVVSENHMNYLLREDIKFYGFGITIINTKIYIVIRGKK